MKTPGNLNITYSIVRNLLMSSTDSTLPEKSDPGMANRPARQNYCGKAEGRLLRKYHIDLLNLGSLKDQHTKGRELIHLIKNRNEDMQQSQDLQMTGLLKLSLTELLPAVYRSCHWKSHIMVCRMEMAAMRKILDILGMAHSSKTWI